MKTLRLIVTALLAAGTTAALAADSKTDIGLREYMNSCAICHGQDGRANMQVIDILKQPPSNLRLLSKRNGGVFPVARVYEVVDGRNQVSAHGTREMPIWGDRYAQEIISQRLYYDDYPRSPENYAHSRILALIDYLSRIQDK